MQADGQTDMTELAVAFRNFVKRQSAAVFFKGRTKKLSMFAYSLAHIRLYNFLLTIHT
jgi:hypothetical protein